MGFGRAGGHAHVERKQPTPIAQSRAERPEPAPQLFHHQLGTLNAGAGGYTTQVSWCGTQIELSIQPSFSGETEDAINCALQLLSERSVWMPRVEQYAASELLEKKNDIWLEEDEEPLSTSQFVEKLSLESIDIDDEGNFTFWFNDGELFWGHTIQVGGSLSQGPTDAGILG
jgi:hypothetical protein